MAIPTKQRISFEDYLTYDAGTDTRYELVRGELRSMNPPTLLHIKIAKFLERAFDREIERLGYPWEAFREVGQRTQEDSSRLPDVCVTTCKHAEALLNQSAVLQAPALLIVEIVSPSSRAEDYKDKLVEYQSIGITEYWVVDPESKQDKRVTVHQLASALYHKQEFRGSALIASATFPELKLTAQQVLAG